jgi:hypothetical protein
VAVACDIHAERHLAKAGGSKRKLRGIPTLAMEQGGVERAERTRRSAQAQRGRLGKRLAGAWGLAPQRSGSYGKQSIGDDQLLRFNPLVLGSGHATLSGSILANERLFKSQPMQPLAFELNMQKRSRSA